VSTLKNCCVLSFLEAQTDILNYFRIQVAVSLLKPPHRSFRIETTVAPSGAVSLQEHGGDLDPFEASPFIFDLFLGRLNQSALGEKKARVICFGSRRV
jgi:hypothetical protein